MSTLSIVLGIFYIISGIFCFVAPISTFFSVVTGIAISMFIFGIFGVVRYFKTKRSVADLIISILAIIIGFVYLFRPGNTPAQGNLIGLDKFVLFMTAAWFLVKGCYTAYYSYKTRILNSNWVLSLISGILSIVLGIYSFIYPSTAAATIGMLAGLWLIQCGIDLIVFGRTAGRVIDAVADAQEEMSEAAGKILEASRMSKEELREAAKEYKKEYADAVEVVEEARKEMADAIDEARKNPDAL